MARHTATATDAQEPRNTSSKPTRRQVTGRPRSRTYGSNQHAESLAALVVILRREDFVALASEIEHPGGAFSSNQRTTTSPARTRASTSARVTASTSLRAERMA